MKETNSHLRLKYAWMTSPPPTPLSFSLFVCLSLSLSFSLSHTHTAMLWDVGHHSGQNVKPTGQVGNGRDYSYVMCNYIFTLHSICSSIFDPEVELAHGYLSRGWSRSCFTSQHVISKYLSHNYPSHVTFSVVACLCLLHYTGLVLGLRPANERRCYKVTPSLIGWSQT